jgi:hypothetical protein
METFIIVLGAFIIAILGMSIGVILSNRKIKGSCAGIAKIMGDSSKACEICAMKRVCEESGREVCEDGTLALDTNP